MINKTHYKHLIIAYLLLLLPLIFLGLRYFVGIGVIIPFGLHQLYVRQYRQGIILMALSLLSPAITLILYMQIETLGIPMFTFHNSFLSPLLMVTIMAIATSLIFTLVFLVIKDVFLLPKYVAKLLKKKAANL